MVVPNDVFERLCRARRLLADPVNSAKTVKSVAREVGISPCHFIRQFRALFGVTPHQFRIEARLQQARGLLMQHASVTNVCMEVGMSSLGSFSDQFSHRIGQAPSAWQRQAIEAPELANPGCLTLMANSQFSRSDDSQQASKLRKCELSSPA